MMVPYFYPMRSYALFSLTELEPRRPRNEVSDLFINIGATLEDHVEVVPPSPYFLRFLTALLK